MEKRKLHLEMNLDTWRWVDEWRLKPIIPYSRARAVRHIFELGVAAEKARIEAEGGETQEAAE